VSVPEFNGLRVAVVGDFICDHYLMAEPRGLSREAPVIVLRHTGEHVGAGGAANVARNLGALGAETRCVGAVGRDARGRELIELLEGHGLDTSDLLTVPGWTTPTKTRVLAAEPRRSLQQVLRLDREPDAPVGDDVRADVTARVRALAETADAVVVSDYEYALLDEELARETAALAEEGLTVVLDPRSSLAGFDGVTALTPNVSELARFTGRASDALTDDREVARAAAELLDRFRTRWLLVTRGNLGMALFGEDCPADGVVVAASGAGNVTDVTGAGDTAAAVFALALAAEVEPVRAMALANAASGVVVMEHGAAVCTPVQLSEAARLAQASPSSVLTRRG
jgi:rfaE bifunctional protein kinase chain/domain